MLPPDATKYTPQYMLPQSCSVLDNDSSMVSMANKKNVP